MIYKTLIIFDTNRIRKTDENSKEITYSDFKFGGDYGRLRNYLKENELEQYVTVAVPSCVVEELKSQMFRQFVKDKKTTGILQSKLSKIKDINFSYNVKSGFKIEDYITNTTEEYIKREELCIITVDETKHADLLKSLKIRMYRGQKPFDEEGRGNLKDALIWEEIMWASGYDGYDQIILYTNNEKDFTGCPKEFIEKYNKSFDIQKEWVNLQTKLEEIYGEYNELKDYYKFAKTDYFRDHLTQQLKQEKIINLGVETKKIQYFEVLDCGIDIKCDVREIGDDDHAYEVELFEIYTKVSLILEDNTTIVRNYVVSVDDNKEFWFNCFE